uniref:Uncharacterized protein n=1 Tax=Oryza rufipogon TaxID=4529 RepID=A0A0E0P709_ORYRU
MVPLQPATCMLADLSRSQDATAGDGTTTVFVLTGSLLRHTHSLLSTGSLLAVDAALAVVDLAHPDLLDLRGGGGEADAALASSDRKKIRGLDSFSSLEVCRGGERGCGCGLDSLGCRGGRRGSSWARSGKLRCAARPLMSSTVMLCARVAIWAVAREGDEDENRDNMSEEDGKGDLSGMVSILDISSSM